MLCQNCNGTLIGRAGKRFCSDSCRNNYNNDLNKDRINYVRNTNNALRRNRRVLERLLKEGRTKIHKQELLDTGFNPKIHTSTATTKNNRTYIYCYEYGYLQLDDGNVHIVKLQNL